MQIGESTNPQENFDQKKIFGAQHCWAEFQQNGNKNADNSDIGSEKSNIESPKKKPARSAVKTVVPDPVFIQISKSAKTGAFVYNNANFDSNLWKDIKDKWSDIEKHAHSWDRKLDKIENVDSKNDDKDVEDLKSNIREAKRSVQKYLTDDHKSFATEAKWDKFGRDAGVISAHGA